jgi:hypothetical protein
MSKDVKAESPKEEAKVKMIDLVLDRPMTTNGVALGWEVIDGKPEFTGKVTVTEAIAEDLKARMALAQESDRARLRNDGQTIDAAPGGIAVGGA